MTEYKYIKCCITNHVLQTPINSKYSGLHYIIAFIAAEYYVTSGNTKKDKRYINYRRYVYMYI